MEALITSHLATFEALRKLGFTDDQLSVRDMKTTVLKVGEIEFTIQQEAEDDLEPATFEAAWKAALAEWPDRTPGERRYVYRRVFDEDTLADMAQAITKKGIKIPVLE